MQVAMLPLVVAPDLAQVRRGPDGGDGAFAVAGHRRGVVAEVLEGGVAHVVAVSHDVGLGDESGVFQVAVGDVPGGVGRADQGGLHVRGKGVSPVVALPSVIEVHAAHAGSGRVSGTEKGGKLWHYLGKVCGSGAQAGGQPTEGVNVAVHEGGETDPVVGGLVLGDLQGAEQAGRSRDGGGDEPQPSEDAAPLLSADAP